MCFSECDEHSNPIFSRIGVIRLLTAIDKQWPNFNLCQNWSRIKTYIRTTLPRTIHCASNSPHMGNKQPQRDWSNHTSRTWKPSFNAYNNRPQRYINSLFATANRKAQSTRIDRTLSGYEPCHTQIFTPSNSTSNA